MSGCIIPEGYTPRLNVYETQRAIEFIKRSFQKNLGSALNLKRVSAPLFVRTDTGLNDDLNGIERPVSFDVPAVYTTPPPRSHSPRPSAALRRVRQNSAVCSRGARDNFRRHRRGNGAPSFRKRRAYF